MAVGLNPTLAIAQHNLAIMYHTKVRIVALSLLGHMKSTRKVPTYSLPPPNLIIFGTHIESTRYLRYAKF